MAKPDSPRRERRRLTHFDRSGRPRMVDVSEKPPTARRAVAEGMLALEQETISLIVDGGMTKGDVLTVESFPQSCREAHAPAAGNPGRTNPVFCMNVAGPCTFDFETKEWTKAISSTQLPRCGTRSLIHLPH